MENDNYVYILDLYNPYDKDEIIDIIQLNNRRWAIKKVKLDWGKPILSSIETSSNQFIEFKLYNNLAELRKYINQIKK